MAQTGYTPISIYYSATAAATPTAGNLVAGELAINTADGKLFYKDSAGTVQVLATKGGVGSSSNTQVLYNSSGLVVGSSNFVFDGVNIGLGTSSPSTYVPVATYSTTFAARSGDQVTSLSAYYQAGVDQYSVLKASNAANSGTTVLRYQATGHYFYTNTTELMRIDSSGNVMIGKTSVTGTNTRLNVQLVSTSPSGYTAATNAGISLDCGTNTNGVINLIGNGDIGLYWSNSTAAYDIGVSASGVTRGIIFTTSGAEKMRLSSGGQLGIGKSPAYTLDVNGSAYITPTLATGGFNIISSATYNDTSAHTVGNIQNNSGVLYIRGNGGTSAIPFWANGGGGVAYQWTWLLSGGTTLNTPSGTSTYTQAGAGGSTFSIDFSGGSGVLTITRTSGSSAYSVYLQILGA
jgi:hypothetical protein